MKYLKYIAYRGFTILKLKPGNRVIYKIYQNDVYKATSSSEVYAIGLINFCLKHGVWND